MPKEIIAGVSASGNLTNMAVFEMDERETKLVYLDEYSKSSDETFWFLEKILAPKIRILKKITKLSIALDPSSVFHHVFPIDTTLNQSEQNEHVHWELSNLIPDYQAKEYINDPHILETRARDQIAEVLVVAVRRSYISNLQEIFDEHKIGLHVVDTGYFGAEHSLMENYPEVKLNTAALISVQENHTDIGVISNGRTVKYGYLKDRSTEHIMQTLRRLQTDVNIQEVYFCGTSVSSEIMDSIKNNFNANCILLNPFRSMVDKFSPDNINAFIGGYHRFAGCTGLAIQRI